ncbi:MAG: tetratricopeptide repeat protein [Planctomycetota bacterium]
MDLSKHLEKADEAVKKRNYAMAADIYSKLLAMQPDNGEARAGLRRALFKKAEAKRPSKVVAMVGGGVHLLSGAVSRLFGKHAAAAKAYERYLALDPRNEVVNVKLGDSLERAGYKRSALAVYHAVAEVDQHALEAAKRAGALLQGEGRFEDALQMYEQVLRIDPRDQDALKARKNLAAEGALRKTGLEQAKHTRDLLKDSEAQRQIERDARLQLSAAEIADELTKLEEQLAERPDDGKLLRRVAELRRMDDDAQGALDCLERALQLEPNDGDLADKVGDLRLMVQERRVAAARKAGDEAAAGRARQALAELQAGEYRRRVQRNPTDLGLRYHLGAALVQLERLDEGIAELQQAVKDPRAKIEAWLLLGQAFRKKGLDDLAQGQLQKALDAAGPSGKLGKDILYEMGSLAQAAGRRDQALSYFSRILEQDIGFRDTAQRVDQLKSA